MSAHTPGPWFLCREGLKGKTYSIQTQEWGTTHPLPEADARLIAATPDLLAALKNVVRDLEAIADNTNDGRVPLLAKMSAHNARAAIAKAEGTS